MLEKGNIVKVQKTEYSLAENKFKTLEPQKVKILDMWDDYEVGHRFKGMTKDKKEIYFSQWELFIPTYKSL